jgi:hypothetical protein
MELILSSLLAGATPPLTGRANENRLPDAGLNNV